MQHVVLPLQDGIQAFGIGVENLFRSLQPAVGAGTREQFPGALGKPFVTLSLLLVGRPDLEQSLEFGETRILWRRATHRQQFAPGARSQRPTVVVVRQTRQAIIDVQLQFARLQSLAIGVRQHADMHPEWVMQGQFDIEKMRILAERSMGEHMLPPRIIVSRRHVIRHDVDEYAEIVAPGAFDEALPSLLAAEILADPARVGYIVAMHASGRRLQTRRQIHVADAEISEVRQDSPRRIQGKVLVHLQTIRRCPVGGHAAHFNWRSWLSTTNDLGAMSTIRLRFTTSRSNGKFGRAVSNTTFQPE